MYTRMHGNLERFFWNFLSIYQFFLKTGFRAVSGQSYIAICSQFLDRSSNLKAGCKKDAIYDAFDTIYVSYSHISGRNTCILCNFVR